MFRQSLLQCACLAVLGLALTAAPARSQDRSTYERLDRLERDLNMLQRHVYRGAPAPMLAGDGGAAVNMQIRMDRLEAQMRDLTGRVEEFTNQFEQIRHRLDQLGDGDMRFAQTPAGAGPLASAGPPPRGPAGALRPPRPGFPPPPGSLDDEPIAPSAGDYEPGSLSPPGMGPPARLTPGFGTLTPPGSSAPGSSAELASAGPPRGALPAGSATEQYNHAFGLLKQANYPAAEAALKAFVAAHPKDQMAGNAQYWLGETYYARGRYMEAATAFAEGYKHYPKSSKAADGLLKLGMSLARANQKQNACVALQQLDRDFPHAAASVRERAATEKKRLGC
jgi:tol-pal system protein YbgF